MIKDFVFEDFHHPYEDISRSDLGEQLALLQRQVKELNIPVLIIVDGWESSGKGFVIKDLIRELDQRTCKVALFENPNDEEKTRPFLWRFWNKIPKKGMITIFDRSFYFKVMNDRKIKKCELEKDIEDISSIEQQLCDDNTIIIKFFLHQKEETQKERIEVLQNDENRSFFVTKTDLKQNKHYDKYLDHFDIILKQSNFKCSPWHIVSSEDLKFASRYILGISLELIEKGINRILEKQTASSAYIREDVPEENILEKLDLSLAVEEEVYDQELKTLQKQAQDIAYRLYVEKVPCCIVFEGMDAAGKGGVIKRLTRMMDPRGLDVVPVSAPDTTEKSYHYLWRFYRNFPQEGKITIFDRSWYGRVLVERVEGFTPVFDWDRAYDEINQMEKHLNNFGTIIIKFLIFIDKDEQLIRFQDRESDERKLYKITDEDWRNRQKWDQYIEAMNEMLVRTNTDYAPWIIVEGNDKKFARLKVLKCFIECANKALEDK